MHIMRFVGQLLDKANLLHLKDCYDQNR